VDILNYSNVTNFAFSPDGALFTTANKDGTVDVYNANTIEKLHTLKGHEPPVHFVNFSPDGSKLVSCQDNTAIIWDIK
jgi:WD40 repeat protein